MNEWSSQLSGPPASILSPDYYSQIRTEIRPLMPDKVQRLVDVGCGEGATAAWLKSTGICDWACGVEFIPAAAAIARNRLDQVIEGNVETMELPISESSIDAILCLDILEHLVDPWPVVARLHKLLKPGGTLIASIPNVRNLAVLLPLLFLGRWDYTESGILDQTHLRFFTRRSATALVSSSGLQITAVRPICGGYPRLLNMLSVGVFSNLLARQYLVAAKKIKPD